MSNKGVGALIHCPATARYLVVRRDSGDYSGTWCCLGGGVDKGESLKQALFRELYEEANIFRKDILTVTPKCVVKSGDYLYTNCLATCEKELYPKLNEEHDGYMWVTREELLNLNLHPKFKLALNEILKD